MEVTVETYTAKNQPVSGALSIQLLGPFSVSRNATPLPLPASRKVRALMAFLAVNHGGISRSSLCDLLWDTPDDPRGELRWCLSKIRSVLGDADKQRIETANDRIVLNVSDCVVDAIAVDKALVPGVAQVNVERLRSVSELFRGEFLEGLQIEGSARFNGWLLAQRHRFKSNHLSVVETLVSKLQRGSDEHFQRLQAWLQLAPFDRRAHEALLLALAECGRVPDAEAHLAATIRQMETEGLDWLPLREAWRSLRAKHAAPAETAGSAAVSRTSVVNASLSKTRRGEITFSDNATLLAPGDSTASAIEITPKANRRASVVVMPFGANSIDGAPRGGMADGLAEDVITRLAKLRTFFVIARGSACALGERNIGPQEAGRILNVDYVVNGRVRATGKRVAVAVELVETVDGRIRWSDEFECAPSDAFATLDDIGNRIVAAVAEEIETAERNRAVLKAPNSLDAWEAYHRGLWHMYRFSGADNDQAEHFFRASVCLDPTFARAHAALSFTHFQNAFLHRFGERAQQMELAYQAAGQSLMADDRDPAAHWAMGRALWLKGQQDESLRELTRSIELSPNFALGHYTLGFVHSQSGDPHIALDSVSYSRSLSPFDPLQFAMLATNALAHARLGHYEEAASWALKAAARPNAHTHILAIAAHCLAVANRCDEARAFAALIRKELPHYCFDDFSASFHFDKDTLALFRSGAQRIGFA